MDWVSTAIGIGSALLKGSGDRGSDAQKPFVQQPPPQITLQSLLMLNGLRQL